MDFNIYETSDYSIFKRLKGNRDVTKSKKIIESINKVGYVLSPIMVNEDMEVIDGQNRLDALSQLGLPVHYYFALGTGIDEAISLNIGRTNWKPIDYVKSYAENGVYPYVLLLKLLESHECSIAEIHPISKGIIANFGYNPNELNNGEYKMSEDEYYKLDELLGYLDSIDDCIKRMNGTRRVIKSGIAFCLSVKGVNKERLISQFKKYYPSFRPVVRWQEFLEDIEDMYNKKYSKKIFFYSEYKMKNARC